MPRKSTTSVTTAAAAETTVADTSILSHAQSDAPTSPRAKRSKISKQEEDIINLESLLLPRSLVARIARGCLPANTALQKDALLALTKSATVFISLLAGEANSLTDKKTIQPADVSAALGECEHAYARGRVAGETQLWEQEVRVKRRGWRDNQIAREKEREKGKGEKEEDEEEGGESMQIDEQFEHSEEHRPIKIRLTNGAKKVSGSENTGEVGLDANPEAEQEDSDDNDDEADDDEDVEEDQKDDDEEGVDEDDEDATVERENDDPRQKTGKRHNIMAPGGAVDLDDADDGDSNSENGGDVNR